MDDDNYNNNADNGGSSGSNYDGDDYITGDRNGSNRPKGPLGVDPLHFSLFLFCMLLLFVLYLLLPRAVRKQYFSAYPKRHAWSARIKSMSSNNSTATGNSYSQQHQEQQQHPYHQGGGNNNARRGGQRGDARQSYPRSDESYGTGSSSLGTGAGGGRIPGMGLSGAGAQRHHHHHDDHHQQQQQSLDYAQQQQQHHQQQQQAPMFDLQQNDEIVISAAMQQLRDPGVLIVAHGSRGKPKTVRLQLTESAITWRTETRKKITGNGKDQASRQPKMGKLHQVPLSHIMYVDVGKQTTALRRVENASVSESLCFSLLTKEGSLDLEANSSRERDALVSCFSLVLDEVHAQNWRDIYRGPSSDMPSSFDELDRNYQQQQQQHQDIEQQHHYQQQQQQQFHQHHHSTGNNRKV